MCNVMARFRWVIYLRQRQIVSKTRRNNGIRIKIHIHADSNVSSRRKIDACVAMFAPGR